MKHNAVALISRIRESANRLILDELAAAGMADLSPSHGDILAVLYSEKSMTMHQIALRIHRTKATTTVLVNKLEKLGLVQRVKSADDGRYTSVSLTEYGLSFKEIFDRISLKLNSAIYGSLTASEAETLETLLEKVRKNIV